MKRAVSVIKFVLVYILAYSQNVHKVSATYTYYAPETMSIDEAKRTAVERAKIKAIANEFGTSISQNNSTIISNNNGITNTQFLSVGGSEINGEWIETIGEPKFDIRFDEHYLIVNCSIVGIIGEKSIERIEISTKLLRNGTSPKFESSEFTVGDDMYLWVQAPSKGYILVFWIDYKEDKAYRILPYQEDSKDLMPIAKDKKYVFFSKAEAEDAYSPIVDEFVIVCQSEKERNDVYILFSEKKFSVNLIDGLSDGIKWLSLRNFHKWLMRTKNNHPYVTINQLNLTIKNNEENIY